ncbi:MAG TPA: SOS response-associated peptidase [Kofleriaceae bacterium]|nr:SOS response-associated peptidase [Kofleriaceae bacterium]
MCGRYTVTRQDRIAEEFGAVLGDAEQSAWWKPRFNVAPTQPAPVIVAAAPARGGPGAPAAAAPAAPARKIELMRWGLVPHWAGPGGKAAPLMINARVESLDAKPMFRDALHRRRCLVPADGFFEWLRDAKAGSKAKPQPIYMHPASRRLIAFAGLWAWHRPRGASRASGGAAGEDARTWPADDETLSFTIITGTPNELVRAYHDRMPLVLDPAAYAAWLDPATPGEAAYALLRTPPVGDWIAERVSTAVNSAARDEPDCIAPLAAAAPAQQSLFD